MKCTLCFSLIAVPEAVAQGGRETLQQVIAAFHKSRQQSTFDQSPVKLDAENRAMFSVFADLHDRSVLYLDGANWEVTFPYPEGLEAFELAVKQISPRIAPAPGPDKQ